MVVIVGCEVCVYGNVRYYGDDSSSESYPSLPTPEGTVNFFRLFEFENNSRPTLQNIAPSQAAKSKKVNPSLPVPD